eukprot:GFYU01011762.1.p1 GENE.GFYU01011762.1~~GFYU01011762.1.p1  ORF type:complete len:184 (+),score=44.52 GFYU01011762.1:107-658(+)
MTSDEGHWKSVVEGEQDEDWPLPTWIEGDSLAPYRPCEESTVDHFVKSAGVTKDDVVYDLGCGDGRVVIGAAKRTGCRGVGVELEEDVALLAKQNTETAGVSELVQIRQQDLEVDSVWEQMQADGTIFFAFLLPEGLEKIESRLWDLVQQGKTLALLVWGLPNHTATSETAAPGGHSIYFYRQ